MEPCAYAPRDGHATLDAFLSLLSRKDKELYLHGFKGSFFSYFLASLSTVVKRPFLVIVPDNDAAAEMFQALRFYLSGQESGRPVALFPAWETLPYDTCDPDPGNAILRVETLYRLQETEAAPIAVVPVRALLQQCLPASALKRAKIVLELFDEVDRDQLGVRLIENGYRQVPLVEERGEFSVRGGIVDLFPPSYAAPLRLEFFGDQVESIRAFDPVTQRSVSTLEEAVILPVSEVVLDSMARAQALKSLEEKRRDSEAPGFLFRRVREHLEAGTRFPGISFLLQFFYSPAGTLFEYLSPEPLVWFHGMADFAQRLEKLSEAVRETLAFSSAKEDLCSLGDGLYLSSQNLQSRLACFTRIRVEELDIFSPDQNALRVSTSDNKDVYQQIVGGKTQQRPFAKLAQTLRQWVDDSYWIVLAIHSQVQVRRAKELLENYGLFPEVATQFPSAEDSRATKGRVLIVLGELHQGFRSRGDRLAVLAETEIFGEKIIQRVTLEAGEAYAISSLEDLQVEDFVVHVDYGIGQYKGLQSLDLGGSRNDFLLIEYRDQDRLYVPVYRLNLVQKYRGVEDQPPMLHKLGGKAWVQTKKKVEKSIMAHAKELLRLYAARQALEGFAFSQRDQLYREFEARFEYEETRDQLRAIEEVMGDMERGRPMDRLICGDVGYGKTEVALRGSFRAVMDNKQVAVVVPTTVLAYQHFQTFSYRFRDFPVSVAMMSRFQTKAEQKEIAARLKDGGVDIVVGTHRLLQKDIGFKDLGLVIIDEEHRFGVRDKEKLKNLRLLVDVLTLSATPIPRTLQLSLLGVRDLSIINSPPEDRLAVQSFVTYFDDQVIREAVIREFLREGQVFFVHNRVEKIVALAKHLRELVPEANLAVAHGQMPEKELEKVMWAFHQREVNLLLCTSIIESGLDFPHANTIIIDRADKLGLAQLYQLRGRVGRSTHQAYAYFIIPRGPLLPEKAKKRLAVISQFSDLSSGYRLATLDLELRGGGNILGLSQSGHIAQVGIDLYYELIEKAVKEIKGEKILPEVDPEIRLKVSAYIPEEYVPDIHQRLKLYKKLAAGMEEHEVGSVRNELQDRYGPIPQVAENLLSIAAIKVLLKKHLVTSLEATAGEIVLSFHPEAEGVVEKILALTAQPGSRIRFTPDHKLCVPCGRAKGWDAVIAEVKKILQ